MPTTDSDSSGSPLPDCGTTPGRYDFAFEPVSVYASVVALIDRHVPNHGVHLDLGCGHGAIAEPVAQRGQIYVGADLDTVGLSARVAGVPSPASLSAARGSSSSTVPVSTARTRARRSPPPAASRRSSSPRRPPSPCA